MEWKYSSVGVRSLAIGLTHLKCEKDALATMQPATRFALANPMSTKWHALANPMSTKWHDGFIVVDAAEAVQRLEGNEGVEALNYAAVKQSIGPIMSPFLSVTLTLFGASPDSILKRMDMSLRSLMLNVSAEWKSTGPNSGLLVVTHPDPVHDVSWWCWKGSLRFVYEMCGKTGDIVRSRVGATDCNMVFDCSWKPAERAPA